jgi:membrane-associated phospholipid phosphatase
MQRLFGTLFVLTLASATPAYAQAPAAAPAPTTPVATTSLERQFLKNLLNDQKAIWTSPFHIRPADVWWVAPIAGGTAAFIATDRKTGDWIAGYPELKPVSDGISYAGTVYSVGGAALTFYVIGRATHNDRARETGLLGAEALVNSFIVAGVVKGVTQRSRPDDGEDRGRFWTGGTSFPSGHSIQIWSVATVVAHEYRDTRWVPVVAYGSATLVALSRFPAQRHYLSDVLVGSSLGYLIGRYVYHAHHQVMVPGASGNLLAGTNRWPMIAPQFDRRARTYGVQLAWIY